MINFVFNLIKNNAIYMDNALFPAQNNCLDRFWVKRKIKEIINRFLNMRKLLTILLLISITYCFK
jgi:hypothetical protein